MQRIVKNVIKKLILFLISLPLTTFANNIDPASEWDLNLLNLSKTDNYSSYDNYAPYMHVAIYNAIEYINNHYTLYTPPGLNVPTADANGASSDAAAISAAYNVLKEVFASTDMKTCTTSHPLYKLYQDSLASRHLSTNDKGILIGQQAALGLVGNKNCGGRVDGIRRNDGVFPKLASNFVKMPLTNIISLPNSSLSPGKYIPTLPNKTNTIAPPVLQFLAVRKPFIVDNIDSFLPGPPISIQSTQYAFEFDEMKYWGGKEKSLRSPTQTSLGFFWSGNIPKQKSDIMRGLVTANPQIKLSSADIARLYAMFWLVMADAEITCFKAKYLYMTWRPETAIRNGDYDGNNETQGDPNWLPSVVTPYAPEYPNAHACWAAAIAGVANHFFGTKQINVFATSDLKGAGPCDRLINGSCERTIKGTDEFAEEVSIARIFAGAHFLTSTYRGYHVGDQIADFMAEKTPYLKPKNTIKNDK